MIRYLVLGTSAAALTRSAAAWDVIRPPASRQPRDVTSHLWGVRPHPSDGRGAVEIPDTPQECGIVRSQGGYDGLLSAGERSARLDALPADWAPSGSRAMESGRA